MTTQRLDVELAHHRYPIHIGSGLLAQTAELIADLTGPAGAVIIADEVHESTGHLATLRQSLAQVRIETQVHVVPGGETSKSLTCFSDLCEAILSRGVERTSVVIALGGGVIGDLAGYVAASLLRGLPLVQIPTTLLSQVDSSVGGKTGLNASAGKNLIGAFYQPDSVIIDTDLLATLSEREMRAGYAEVVKYGLLGDAAFFEWLEAHGQDVLARAPKPLVHAIYRSCEMKAEIVRADERETSGRRALLNLGHTFAHAYERLGGYDGRLLHGEAVSCGMLDAIAYSESANLAPEGSYQRVHDHLSAMGMPLSAQKYIGQISADSLLTAMYSDKKVKHGRLRLVLLHTIGDAFLFDHDDEEPLLRFLDGRLRRASGAV